MNSEHKVTAIIAAGGSGTRMGEGDKLFADLKGKPVLAHTVSIFEASDAVSEIVIAIRDESIGRCREMINEYGWKKVSAVVSGGKRRQDSVYHGLEAAKDAEWVLVHDGARPLISVDIITRGLKAAAETGAAIAAVPVKDTIKLAGPDLTIMGTPPRENLWAAQTPQIFRRDILAKAYTVGAPDVSDDSALVERLGTPVKLFHGSYDNIKITTPDDLSLAEILLKD